MNTAVHLPWETKASHLNDLNYKMLVSGYSDGFRVKVMEGGIRGYINLLYRCQVENKPINQPRNIDSSRKKKKHRKQNWISRGSVNYDSVLFIPATPGSLLAKEIRRLEAENRQGRETRIRVVELTGKTLRNTLGRSYPWNNKMCGSDDCFPCKTNTDLKVSCRRPGVGYRIVCTLCQANGTVASYYGESGRNMFTRGKEHLREFKAGISSNCMVIHSRRYHQSSKELIFRMEPSGLFNTPLDRQLDESMRIRFSSADIIMNSGAEWRGDPVPRASFGPSVGAHSSSSQNSFIL